MVVEEHRTKKSWLSRTKASNSARARVRDEPKRGAPLNFQEKFTARAIRHFGKAAAALEKNVPTLGDDLLKSDYFLAPQAFLSIVLFITALSSVASVIGIALFLVTHNLMYIPLVVVPLGALVVGLSLPSMSKSSRANAIDGEIAFVIGYLSVLITGGISPIE